MECIRMLCRGPVPKAKSGLLRSTEVLKPSQQLLRRRLSSCKSRQWGGGFCRSMRFWTREGAELVGHHRG